MRAWIPNTFKTGSRPPSRLTDASAPERRGRPSPAATVIRWSRLGPAGAIGGGSLNLLPNHFRFRLSRSSRSHANRGVTLRLTKQK